jgi:hypothetical protein
MDPALRTAVVVVHAALLAYTVGVVLEQRGRRATRAVVAWLTVGVVCDVLATAGMILGSARGLLTLHGVLGYSALVGMTVDTVRMWRHRLSRGEEPVPRALHLFSRFAYLWWVVAYVTGAALVMLERAR